MKTRVTLPLVLRIVGTMQLLALWLWGLAAWTWGGWVWTLGTLVVSTLFIWVLLHTNDEAKK